MKYYLYLFIVLAMTACSSSDSADDPKPTPQPTPVGGVKVAIETEIVTRAAAKSAYASGDEMNVWAKTYGSTAAADIVAGIKGQYNGGKWALTPDVSLDQTNVKNAFIYAMYPYSADNVDKANAINIDVTTQTDVLYSGSYVPVTYTTYTAKLKMKHALSLASFNIMKDGYSGAGQLQSLTLYGDSIYTKGKMNVEKGKVSGVEKGEVYSPFSKTITASGWTSSLPQLWVIPLPFNTKSTKAYLKTVIDGKEYISTVPEVEMRMGFQYIFHLILTDNGLQFIPDQTTSVDLNEQTDEIGELHAHGILNIVQQGAVTFSALYMQGDNVFGTVNWGDNSQESYADGISHDYTSSGQHTIKMETWNSIGFQFRNLKGVAEIDISGY